MKLLNLAVRAFLCMAAFATLPSCSVSQINIPGIGFFDFDPSPLDTQDRQMQYQALLSAVADPGTGKKYRWKNPETTRSGYYVVTRHMTRKMGFDQQGPIYQVPAAEVSEWIFADGRHWELHGMCVYQESDGSWMRYR